MCQAIAVNILVIEASASVATERRPAIIDRDHEPIASPFTHLKTHLTRKEPQWQH